MLLPALCLAAAVVLGGMLTVPVAATSAPVPPNPTRADGQPVEIPGGATFSLELSPAEEGITNEDQLWLGEDRTYKAEAVVTYAGKEIIREPVTDLTGFTLEQDGRPSGTCKDARCKPRTAGDHTVKGKVPKWKLPDWLDKLPEGTATLPVTPVMRTFSSCITCAMMPRVPDLVGTPSDDVPAMLATAHVPDIQAA